MWRNCKGFLEMVLGFSIAQVVVSKEKSIVYHPEYKVSAWISMQKTKIVRIAM